jgi:hypothetical protein
MSLGIYRINYDTIIEDANIPTAIRLLAAKLKSNPMMTVGKFFANLSDDELIGLRELTFDIEASTPELLLLTMMLSAAEGTSALDEDELANHINATNFFIATAVLHRQGFCTAYFDKFSYGDDMSHHVLAEPTELGLKYAEQLKRNNKDES